MAPNRLALEKSPYLLQHAHNPVDWHPWSDEAFERAGKEDKPIFLSVGYATCHWCHVMERESFEDSEAASRLNDTFVCIKVDREERPDIDAVYMSACQMLTGSGGWPLTIFMTPDKRPFFAATYLPKNNRFGRMGLVELCQRVKDMWINDRQKVLASAGNISQAMGNAFHYSPAAEVGMAALDAAYGQLEKTYDAEHGGFDTAPKFPTAHRFQFLQRHHYRTREAKALEMVTESLKAMRMGGIWDHVGLGFHRYSTDRQWLLPHFEKMLYDQALLSMAYLEAYQTTGDSFFARTAEEIFTYVQRDMTDELGAFYAAEDADSEGEEGKFYVWRIEEFNRILGAEEAAIWQKVFELAPEGNFADEATKQKTGANIPHLKKHFDHWADEFRMTRETLENHWESARQKLFEARTARVHPLKDDKVLTDWNGLMIAALAMGARLLDNPRYAHLAERAARFILERLRDDRGRLLHRYRDGEAAIAGNSGDYAYLISGLLELYAATFDPFWLKQALELKAVMVDDFWDERKGGFYLTPADANDLPVRPKEIYDGALPSANSVAFLNLLDLERLTGDSAWSTLANDVMRAFAGTVKRQPAIFTRFLCAVDFALGAGREIVIVGDPQSADTREMISSLNRTVAPHARVLLKTDENAADLARAAPFTAKLKAVDEKTTAYVCSNFICKEPTTDVATLVARTRGVG